MSNNILTDFLGIDLKEIKDISIENEEQRKELAVAIVKLTEYPEWVYLENELKRMLENIDKSCEFYAEKPNVAFYDSGMKRAIQIIQNFIQKQRLIVEQYAKKDKKEVSN